MDEMGAAGVSGDIRIRVSGGQPADRTRESFDDVRRISLCTVEAKAARAGVSCMHQDDCVEFMADGRTDGNDPLCGIDGICRARRAFRSARYRV